MKLRNMAVAYDTASLWRPETRTQLLGNVVESAYADSTSDGGHIVISDFGDERVAHFDIHSGHVSPASDDVALIEPVNARTSVSPDGTHRIDLRDHNLWLIDVESHEEKQLTFDGSLEYPYGQARQSKPYNAFFKRPVFLWSPNSRYVVTQRLDLRGVNEITLTEAAPHDGGLPQVHRYLDAFPGDEHVPMIDVLIIDTQSGAIIETDLEPIPATHTSPLMRKDLWWNRHSSAVFLVASTRDWLQLSLVEIDPASGTSRTLIQEEADRRVRPNLMFHQEPNIAVNDEQSVATEAIWFSERDGWGHLYLYDVKTGDCIRQITTGDFVVSRLLRVDWRSRKLWASIAGRVPDDLYRETICQIHIDTGEIEQITNDHYDHRLVMMPECPSSHPWFLDAASTVTEPTHFTLRSWDGEILVDLGSIDTSRLRSTGWQPPQRFCTTAADGVTDIFGTIFFPPDFDPSLSYPVIDHVYPGPQMHRSVPYFNEDDVEPYAALGMIGVTIDGRGTPMRERAFFEASRGNVGAGSGLEDHVFAIKELARTRPWMDSDNVSIHGRSAGGFATARAMELFPEFFKVGIAAAGRYEGRMVMAMIMEKYDDPYDEESWKRASAIESGGDITGKFLIVHGELDADCSIHMAYRLIDKMIDANRDFDLLVVPGDDHVFSNRGNYVERRIWDYLTEHSLGQNPPQDYVISP